MSLSCVAKDWTEGDLKGLPSLCQSSMKEVCLSCCTPTSWSHTWGTPFQQTLSRKTEFREHPSRKVSLTSTNILAFRKAPNLRYWEHVFSVCPHQCSWQVWWHACELSEGFTAVLCGGKHCQKVSEAAALRGPASSYEALLLSAGKCGQIPSCSKC